MAPPTAKAASGSARIAAITAALVLVQQVGAKAARDGLFLSSFSARELPKIMAAASLCSLVVVLATARVMTRVGPARLVPAALLVNAALYGVEASLLGAQPRAVALALYLHVAALGSVLVSGFWSLVTELFDPHGARRAMGRIAAGATLGGALGGLVADVSTRVASSRGLLVVLAVASSFAALAAARLAPPASQTSRASEAPAADAGWLSILSATPYLRALGLLAGLSAVWAALLDFALKTEVSLTFASSEELVRFFGWFYTATGLCTFLFSTVASGKILRRNGIGTAVAILPAVVAGSALLAGALDVFMLLVVVRGIESVIANGLYRASYELFFTPLPSGTKRPTKTIVDVAATRVGDALGGGLILVAIAVMPSLPTRVPVLAAAGFGLAALMLVPRLHQGYVAALQNALKSGTVAISEAEDDLDALTRRTLAESTQAVDREKLLREIEAFQRDKQAALGTMTTTKQVEDALPDARANLVMALLSGDLMRIEHALTRPVERDLVGLLIPLLAHAKLGASAERAIVGMGAAVLGALTDALIDPAAARVTRIRVAHLIGRLASPRAREGLLLGLEVDSAAVRVASARALAHLSRAEPELAPERARVMTAAAAALAMQTDALDSIHPPPKLADESLFGERDNALEKLDPQLYVALALLSTILDQDSITLAANALGAADAGLRGTALEYLENVLDEPAKGAFSARLSKVGARSARRKTPGELLEELSKPKR